MQLKGELEKGGKDMIDMTNFKKSVKWMILITLSPLSVFSANFPLGTQIVSGSVKNYLNELYASDNAVKVQAADTNGHILAECEVHNAVAGSSGENYLLEVPVTSIATGSSIAPGDIIRLYVIDGNELKVAAGTVSSQKANADIRANLRVVDVTFFDSMSCYTNEFGKVAVANEYLALWNAYSDGKKYDPDADEDGDKTSNYFEYLSGTNPFDPSDYLAIKDFQLTAERTAAITFEYVCGHVYSILSTSTLAQPVWATEKTVLPATTKDEPGITTIYVVPTEKSPSRFFMVDPR